MKKRFGEVEFDSVEEEEEGGGEKRRRAEEEMESKEVEGKSNLTQKKHLKKNIKLFFLNLWSVDRCRQSKKKILKKI